MSEKIQSSYRNPFVSAIYYIIFYIIIYNSFHWVFWKDLAFPFSKNDLFYSKSLELVLGALSMGILSVVLELVRNLIGKRSSGK